VTFRAAERADAEAIAELVRAYDRANGGEIETDADEVRDDWTSPGFELARDALVAEDADGRLVAYGWVSRRMTEGEIGLDGYVHPDVPDRALGAELFERMERRAAELGATRLVTGLLGPDRWGAELLAGLGYERTRALFRMAVDLDAPPAAPAWPEGVVARGFRPGDESAFHATIVDAFADEWGFEPGTLEEWRAEHVERDSFDPDLWLLALAGDEPVGALVGHTLGAGGFVRLLGVRSQWRRRGLGLALLRRSFASFWERGRRHVALAVDTENPTGAPHLYVAAGMHETHRIDRWEKGGRVPG
jgi:mycothiol synthase